MNDIHERTLLVRRLDELELRIARLESANPATPHAAPEPVALRPVEAAVLPEGRTEDELELEVGQNWFAKVGIGVLALGAGFTLTLPYAGLPAGVPALAGGLVAGLLFFLAKRDVPALRLVSGWIRGAAMLLLQLAALRLCFFSPQPLLAADSLPGAGLLSLAVAVNFTLAWRRRSTGLVGLALVLAYLTVLAMGAAALVLPGLVALAVLTVVAAARGGWPALGLTGILAGPAAYFLWASGNPLLGHPFHFVTEPAFGPACLLVAMLVHGTGPLGRREPVVDDGLTNSCGLLNCAVGYGVFLVHTVAIYPAGFAASHLAASIVLLGLAVLFWMREQSRVSTFLYAMTGYLALSLAIIKLAPAPGVFVWLSLQSIVVVATAIWFRSRFIVVANFLIYVAIVLAYMVVAKSETGISLGFGIVALVSARILNWQQNRLELKTGLMRNAYLTGAFVVFPYALYHLAPGRYVGLAWVGLALFYYAMNLIVRNQKFRWMGHATLLLTTVYIAVVGTSRFGPMLRVLSFLVLGTVMLVVSLIFTRMRTVSRPAKPE
jgi:hypothetical protein